MYSYLLLSLNHMKHVGNSTLPGHIRSRISYSKHDQVALLRKTLSADNAHGLGNNMLCGILLISLQRSHTPNQLQSVKNRITGRNCIDGNSRRKLEISLAVLPLKVGVTIAFTFKSLAVCTAASPTALETRLSPHILRPWV